MEHHGALRQLGRIGIAARARDQIPGEPAVGTARNDLLVAERTHGAPGVPGTGPTGAISASSNVAARASCAWPERQ